VYNFIPSPKVPVHLLHLGNIVSHVFEDLQKTKAPTSITQLELSSHLSNAHDASHLSIEKVSRSHRRAAIDERTECSG
jgi:hypothetical protein